MHTDYRKHTQQARVPERPKTLEGLSLLFEQGREKSPETHSVTYKRKNYRVFSTARSFGRGNEAFAFYLME